MSSLEGRGNGSSNSKSKRRALLAAHIGMCPIEVESTNSTAKAPLQQRNKNLKPINERIALDELVVKLEVGAATEFGPCPGSPQDVVAFLDWGYERSISRDVAGGEVLICSFGLLCIESKPDVCIIQNNLMNHQTVTDQW